MSALKKSPLIFLALLLLATWVATGTFYYQTSRPANSDPTPVRMEIKSGMTLKQVARQLHQKNLIRGALWFRLLAYIQGKQNAIKAGEYELSSAMLPMDILHKITSGKTVLYQVTIPEGFRITEIAGLLAARDLVGKDNFLQHTRSSKWIETLNIPIPSLEGYLFPETYSFVRPAGVSQIINAMVETFKRRVLTPETISRIQELGFTLHEVITLASLIEKETGLGAERKLISSVFHNRLKKNMLLQTDPTVIYALENFDGNIRKRDLSIDSPYNTYKYRGLPPGPIANPGYEAVIAALHPQQTNYLYFVSKQNGSHHFSSSLAEHNRAVTRYQLKKITRRQG